MKRILMCSCACAFAGGVALADSVFLGADSSGSGDLASADNWGGTLPGSSTAIQFTKSGTLNASESVTFGNMKFNAAGIRVVCDWGLSKTVAFGDYFFFASGVTNVIDGSKVTAKEFKLGQNGGTRGQRCELINGADMTCTRLQTGLYNGWTFLNVDGEGTRFVSTGSSIGAIGMGYVGNNRVRVANGGYLSFNPSGSDGMRIGVMSQNKYACTNNVLEVCAGGTVYCGYLYLGGGNENGVYTPIGGQNAILVEKGGVLSMNALTMGKNNICVPSNRFEIAGLVTNRGDSVVIGAVSGYQALTLNGTFVGTTGVDKEFTVGNSATAPGNRVEVADGATFDWSGRLHVGKSGSSDNTMRVLGAKSFKTGGAFNYVGYATSSCGNTLIVSNVTDATIAGNLYAGYYGSNNRIELWGYDKVLAEKAYIGYTSTATNNSILFAPTSRVTFPAFTSAKGLFGGYFVFGQSGQCGAGGRLEVRNCTFDSSKANFSFGSPGCSVTFGPGTEFYETNSATASAFSLGSSRGSRFVVDNAKVRLGDNVYTYLGGAASSNALEIVNGSTYVLGKNTTFELGKLGSRGNRLYVGSAAELDGYRFRISGRDHEIVISNAVVKARSEFSFPYNDGTTVTNVGNAIIFRGTSPQLRGISCSLNFGGKSDTATKQVDDTVVRFEVPAGGYSSDEPPIKAAENKSIVFSAGTHIEADVAAYVAAGAGRTLLAQTSGTGKITIADAEELAERLPTGARLRLDDAGQALYLRVKSTRGFSMILK